MERATYYARVSTEEEKQLNALYKQVEECKDVIVSKGWEPIDGYVDEGKSGTKVKGRDEYQRLYEDLAGDTFDIVVVKCNDRLGRNTKDWYLFVDRLVMSEKRLYFYMEGVFYTPDDGLISGIRAILAEEFSRDLSKKINNSIKRRLEKAKKGEKLSTFSNGLCYGYDMVDGELKVNEEQAEIVKLIFSLYLEGNGAKKIAKELISREIYNQRGRVWHPRTICNIIQNERYKGTQVSNKTHYDFNLKKVLKNPPSEWVRSDGVVPPIVSGEDWDKAHQIMENRVVTHGIDQQVKTRARGRYAGNSPIGGKVYCGECGSVYWSYYRSDRTEEPAWKCSQYMQYGRKTKKDGSISDRGCDGRKIKKDELLEVLAGIPDILNIEAVESKIKADLTEMLNRALKAVTGGEDGTKIKADLDKLEDMKSRLLDKYLEGVVKDADYTKKSEDLSSRISGLNAKLVRLDKSVEEAEEIKKALKNLDKDIKEYLDAGTSKEDKLQFIYDHLVAVTICEENIVVDLDCLKDPLLWSERVKGWGKLVDTEFVQKVESARSNLQL